jgi:formamidopyrimidine-DNA glycosylase
MPELPEVETVRVGLARLIIGKKLESVDFDWPKSFPNSATDVEAFLLGANVTNVRRRAKVLMIDLSSGYTLVIHLKMTGQLVFVGLQEYRSKNIESRISSQSRFGAGHPNDSLIGQLPDKSTRVMIVFGDKTVLFFNDQRKFGWVRLMPTSEVPNLPFMQKVGPEPLEESFTYDVFKKQLMKRKNSSAKAVLLDQSVLAGLGNIYVDEALWGASVHPETKVVDIPMGKLKVLHREIVDILTLSIEKGGSTNRNYVNAEGKKGSYMDFARVFRRENLPCGRCGTTIIKTRVAGRGTHTCPYCQIRV